MQLRKNVNDLLLAGLLISISLLFSTKIHAKDLGDNFNFYGKISMAFVAQDVGQALSNNSSRFGFKYERADLIERFTTGLRAEFGINTSNTSQVFISIPSSSQVALF